MAEAELLKGSEIVLCGFCGRRELVADNWDVYYGYGYLLPAGRKKKVLVPWKVEENHIQIEHHRVCGATREAGELFSRFDDSISWIRCSECGYSLWFFANHSPQQAFDHIRRHISDKHPTEQTEQGAI